MTIPLVDLKAQYLSIKDEIHDAINRVMNSSHFILGEEVKLFEEEFADFCGARFAIGTSSGTSALHLALLACAVGPGDEVITSPYTFIATVEAISYTGAGPVFVDIDPETFNIDPEKLDQAIKALKSKDNSLHPLPVTCQQSTIAPKGVLAVDLFGLPVDYDRINAIAKKHGLYVIEDAAQSFGAEYKGRKSCKLADIACTSFFPAKPFGCYGDGGMCFTDDDKLAEIIESLRVHGKGTHKYDNVRIGINGRLDTLQAAILLAKFDIFPEEIEFRNRIANKYSDLLSATHHELSIPFVPAGYNSVWAQYSLLAPNEDHRLILQTRLKDAGIPTAVYYPKPLHLQTAFASLGYNGGDFPISEDISQRIFSIPMHPYLKQEDQERIVQQIKT